MNMGGFLPPAVAMARFYQIFVVLLIITAAVVTVVVIRAIPQRAVRALQPSPYPAAYRWLAWGLGGLWVLDGLLQAQPLMITRFIGGLLAPLIAGQPAPLAFTIRMGVRVWGISPVLWNEFAAWIQIAIGLMILLGGLGVWRRRGLWLSFVWGAIVWVPGEAMGSLFLGGSWITGGSPGSVLLYMLVAVLLLMRPEGWQARVQAAFRWGFAGLWALSSVLQALPGAGWWGSGLSNGVLAMAEMPQPNFFSAPLYAWAGSLHAHPELWNGILVGLMGLLAILSVWFFKSPVTWGLMMLFAFGTWWLGQDFGVLGGMGTDPNSGIVVLLALVAYAVMEPQVVFVRHWGKRAEGTVTV